MMRALEPEVRDALWNVVSGYLPAAPTKPVRGRPRTPDQVCFNGIFLRLVTGQSWTTIEWILAMAGQRVSDTTLRARRDEWIAAGVFHLVTTEAWLAYDRIVGFDLERVALDGSNHKAPCGGEGTGVNPFDRGRLGFKWSMAVDANGIPLAWLLDGANRNDYALLEPTLDILAIKGVTPGINQLCLDRGYGYSDVHQRCANAGINNVAVIMRRRPGQGTVPIVGLGDRWIVEAANAWMCAYGQLRRNTDRKQASREAAFDLAVTTLLITRLTDWRDTWHRPNPNIR